MASDHSRQEQARAWGQILARAWADDSYKERLLAEPDVVLREQGMTIPPGHQVRVVESTDQVTYLVLPPRPSDELSEEQLEQAAGGFSSCACTCQNCVD